jgi:hypothetical protein
MHVYAQCDATRLSAPWPVPRRHTTHTHTHARARTLTHTSTAHLVRLLRLELLLRQGVVPETRVCAARPARRRCCAAELSLACLKPFLGDGGQARDLLRCVSVARGVCWVRSVRSVCVERGVQEQQSCTTRICDSDSSSGHQASSRHAMRQRQQQKTPSKPPQTAAAARQLDTPTHAPCA